MPCVWAGAFPFGEALLFTFGIKPTSFGIKLVLYVFSLVIYVLLVSNRLLLVSNLYSMLYVFSLVLYVLLVYFNLHVLRSPDSALYSEPRPYLAGSKVYSKYSTVRVQPEYNVLYSAHESTVHAIATEYTIEYMTEYTSQSTVLRSAPSPHVPTPPQTPEYAQSTAQSTTQSTVGVLYCKPAHRVRQSTRGVHAEYTQITYSVIVEYSARCTFRPLVLR